MKKKSLFSPEAIKFTLIAFFTITNAQIQANGVNGANQYAQGITAAEDTTVMDTLKSKIQLSSDDGDVQYKLSPYYTQLQGWGVKGAWAKGLNNNSAIGFLADYSNERQEYLTNFGVIIDDGIRVTASVGEAKFSGRSGIAGFGMSQRQYGLNLNNSKASNQFRLFDISAFHIDAKANNTEVEAGKLNGVNISTLYIPFKSAIFKLGTGYEWLAWDQGDKNEGVSIFMDAGYRLADSISMNFSAKHGVLGNNFGVGLTKIFAKSNDVTSSLNLTYSHSAGKGGINSDKKIGVVWNTFFGAKPALLGDSTYVGSKEAASNERTNTKSNIIAAMLDRPAYLPNKVMARYKSSTSGSSSTCTSYAANNGISQIYTGSWWNPYSWQTADINNNGSIYVVESSVISIPAGSQINDVYPVNVAIVGGSIVTGILLHMPSNYTSSGNQEMHLIVDDSVALAGQNIRIYSNAIGSFCVAA